jgi:hypothetical protein
VKDSIWLKYFYGLQKRIIKNHAITTVMMLGLSSILAMIIVYGKMILVTKTNIEKYFAGERKWIF